MIQSNLSATTKLNQWWKPKAVNLLTVLYVVMLVTDLASAKALLLLLPSVITILGIGSFGHLVNDWTDIKPDMKVGKPNRLATMSLVQKSGLTGLAVLLALLPWLILPFDNFSIGLLIAEFCLLVVYAVPPIRLKEKKVLPIFIDSLYAYAIPAILAAHTFFLASLPAGSQGLQEYEILILGSLFIWQLALGQRHFLNHLALDRENDLRAGTKTLATKNGNRFVHRLVSRIVFPVELLAFALFFVVCLQSHFLLGILAIGLWFIFNSFYLILALGRDYPFFVFRFSKMTIDHYYQNFLPLIPLVLLLFVDWLYVLVIIAHGFLFFQFRTRVSGPQVSSSLQRMQAPKNFISRYLVYYPAVALLSPFYFLRNLVVAKEAPNPAKGKAPKIQFDNGPIPNKPEAHRKFLNIALVNINKAKYTETFVWKVIPKLQYNVFYLYGGELPEYDNDDRHFLSNWSSLQQFSRFVETIFEMDWNYFLKQSITHYLYAKKISAVIAEFGPVGVQMAPIAKDLGIPLIVNFHGYDIFNREILDKNIEGYKLLFKEAKKIIGVSELMLERLHELGAPWEKLVHLPAYVDLELFSYSDHSTNPPNFLAVGRFTETKSPHLTLLAFKEVVLQIPNAQLTFIGKGGGGELFEACLIMSRALGLEQHVNFLGVQSHEEVAGVMRKARVFVQHSLTTPLHGDMEGKPVAVMEAMAAGLPVIATRHSGIVELIEHNISGILIEEFDIKAMAQAMLTLAKEDSLVLRLGLQASIDIRADTRIGNHVIILNRIIDSAIG